MDQQQIVGPVSAVVDTAAVAGPGAAVELARFSRAFEAWENGFRANPTKFLTAEECAATEVSELSASRAAYFSELLAAGHGSSQEPADVVRQLLDMVPAAAALDTAIRMREHMWAHCIPQHFCGTSDNFGERLAKVCQTDARAQEVIALLRAAAQAG